MAAQIKKAASQRKSLTKVVVDDHNREFDEGFITGCNGTVSGLVADQDHLDTRWESDEEPSDDRLRFPDKLYGREEDLEVLRGLYGEVARARDQEESPVDAAAAARVLFVRGYSGVGKSSLVSQFVKECGDAFFARGKYVQRTSAAAPCAAISDALGQLAAEMMRPARGALRQEVGRALRACGADVRDTMKSAFPSTAPLFIPEPGTDTSILNAPEKEQVAFSMPKVKKAFKIFMDCVCTCLPSPLIFFLDDGQWIDETSFELLKNALSSGSISNMLFIGTYRSNEVNEDHPFQTLMQEVEASCAPGKVKTTHCMELFCLPPDAIGEFISDTLGKEEPADVSTLTEVVYEKTLGNIFYVKQAMEELERTNVLFYDMMVFSWQYNIAKVKMETYWAEDVIDMVKSKINDLPKEVKTIVMILSLVPNAVTLPTVVALLEGEGEDTSRAEKLMSYAVKKGILSRHLDDCMPKYDFSRVNINQEASYGFSHEKIQEAACSMIPEGRSRDELLVRLSNVLIDLGNQRRNRRSNVVMEFGSSPQNVLIDLGKQPKNSWALFVAVNHLNSVPPELVSRMELSRLNTRVGKLNLEKGATAAANLNFLAGLACLDDSGEKWDDYEFTLELLNAVIASEWSMGNPEMSLYHGEEVFKHGRSLEDKSVAYLYRMKALGKDNNHNNEEAMQEGLKTCEMFGVKFPNRPKRSDSIKESLQLKAALRKRSLTSLSELPPTNDTLVFELLKSLQLYSTTSGNTDLGSLVVKRAIRLTLQRGISVALAAILVTYASTMDLSKPKTARKYALAAENILEVFREDKHLYEETRLLFNQLSFR